MKTKSDLNSSRIHVALNTRNLEATIKFYTALLGINPAKVKPGFAKYSVAHPPLNLTLHETPEVKGNGINHFGIEVRLSTEVMKQAERLHDLGLDIRLEENINCCYATQDKVWVKDPDGNAWETFFVAENTEDFYDRHQPSTCQAATPGIVPNCCEPAPRSPDS